MAFTLQNDNGSVDEANAYIAVATFRGYYTDRGVDTAAYGDAAVEVAIVKATDYLDTRYNFVGVQRRPEQRTQWPRWEAPKGLPRALKDAACLLAMKTLSAPTAPLLPTPSPNTTGQRVIEESKVVGPIEKTVKYSDNVSSNVQAPSYPDVDLLLRNSGLTASVLSNAFQRA